ncbi:MAG: hypothetical protein ACO3CV_05075 [Steroidobacteraceae bacterium]
MLQRLRAVTLLVPDLEIVARAYERELGYVRAGTAPVRAGDPLERQELARCERRGLWLRAPLETVTALRLIEYPEGLPPELCPSGWSANEILVEDPVTLARALERSDSGFKIVGPPAPLSSNPNIVACQALGPAGELIYFTRIPPQGGALIREAARTWVDRTFIMVAGGPNLDSMQQFYRCQFGAEVTARFEGIVGVLQQTHGLPADTATPMALVPISPQFVLELDQHPQRRIAPDSRLTLGYSSVALEVDVWPLGPWLTPPALQTGGPYAGEWVGVMTGAAGERLEIIGQPRSSSTSS